MLDGSRSKNDIDAEFSDAFGFEALAPIRHVRERRKNPIHHLVGEVGQA